MKRHSRTVFNAVATSGTNVYTGDPSEVGGMVACSYQLVWTGSAVGLFSVEVSNDYDPIRGTGTWTELQVSHFFPALANVSPAGVAGSTFVDVPEIAAKWIRPKYSNLSSTAVLSGTFHGKQG